MCWNSYPFHVGDRWRSIRTYLVYLYEHTLTITHLYFRTYTHLYSPTYILACVFVQRHACGVIWKCGVILAVEIIVLDIVPKVSIYRNIEVLICRNTEVVIYRSFDMSKYRSCDISIYRSCDISKYRTCFALHPLASPYCMQILKSSLDACIKSKSYISTIFFVYRYHIALHSDIDIQH